MFLESRSVEFAAEFSHDCILAVEGGTDDFIRLVDERRRSIATLSRWDIGKHRFSSLSESSDTTMKCQQQDGGSLEKVQ